MSVIAKLISRFVSPKSKTQIPVLLQNNEFECGAACLAMVASYYGYQITVKDCLNKADVGRDGLKANIIAALARDMGFDVKAYSLQADAFKNIPLPSIVHWNFNHYVVVEHWTTTHVTIIDPARGHRVISIEEFNTSFTGISLTLKPGKTFTPQTFTKQEGVWRFYVVQLASDPNIKRLFYQLLMASLLLQITGLITPVITRILVDNGLITVSSDIMSILGLGIILIFFSRLVITGLRSVLLIYLQTKIDERLMSGFIEYVTHLPYQFFQVRQSGDLLSRLGSNMVIREILSNYILSLLFDSLFVIVYWIAIASLSWTFGVIVGGIGVLSMLLTLKTSRLIYNSTQDHLVAQADVQSYLVEVLNGIATIKMFGGEKSILQRWSGLFYNELSLANRRNLILTSINIVISSLQTFAPFFLLWFGAWKVIDGSMSLGTVLQLSAFAAAFLTPLTSIIMAGQQLNLAQVHLHRLADVLRGGSPPGSVSNATMTLSGAISIENVSFAYSQFSTQILHNISFKLDAGQKIAIVGATGSGKTTLGYLLAGLYSPSEGKILYDGHLLQDIDQIGFRQQVGVVLQKPFLFNSSLRNNIAFHAPDTPFDRIVQASKSAGIHDEIQKMPMGYETMAGENGRNLSGGQQQRLALASALLNNPVLLILDEATSQLDAMTEAAIIGDLDHLNCTKIMISHRLSTIINADFILVLKDGCLIASGTHQELIANSPHYRELIQNQDVARDAH